MNKSASYYSITDVAVLLGISWNAARMRIQRGTYPKFTCNGRTVGVPKKAFWALSAKQEAVGLIRPKNMPQAYMDEREKFLGDMSYEDNVLRGKEHA